MVPEGKRQLYNGLIMVWKLIHLSCVTIFPHKLMTLNVDDVAVWNSGWQESGIALPVEELVTNVLVSLDHAQVA